MRLWDHLVAAAKRGRWLRRSYAALPEGARGKGEEGKGFVVPDSSGDLVMAVSTEHSRLSAGLLPSSGTIRAQTSSEAGLLGDGGSSVAQRSDSAGSSAAADVQLRGGASSLVSLRDLMSAERLQRGGGDRERGAVRADSALFSVGRRILGAMITGQGWHMSPCSSPSFVGPLSPEESSFDYYDDELRVSKAGAASSGMDRSSGRRRPFSSSRLRMTPPWGADEEAPPNGVASLAEDAELLKAVLGLGVGEGHGCETASGSGAGAEGDDVDSAGTDKLHLVGLSLGQQQLLCLARMLLQRRQFVLLDECTASIDASTSVLMRQLRVCLARV